MTRTVQINTDKFDVHDFDFADNTFSFKMKNPPDYLLYRFLRYYLAAITVGFQFMEIAQKVELTKFEATLDVNGDDVWFDVNLTPLGLVVDQSV